MKKVVAGKELNDKMDQAIELLCNTVKTTLGPKGSNIIIDHSAFNPFITNDGVTIAENIESDDAIINTILQLAKEASINTNSTVGDGTTTTLVLLQSIYNLGKKMINDGMNPILLKKELARSTKEIIKLITQYSHIPSEEESLNIIVTSANSKEIGKDIYQAYTLTTDSRTIYLKESNNEKTEIIYKKGYVIDTLIASTFFFKDEKEINITYPYILILNNTVDNMEDIARVINEVISTNRSLIIMAEDYSDFFVKQVINLFLENNLLIYLLKVPEYGSRKLDIFNDLALISNAKIVDDVLNINFNSLGQVESVKINSEETTFSFVTTEKIKSKIKRLEDLINESNEGEKEFLLRRITMFKKGVVDICIGAPTKTERRERKMRYDDALCSLRSASKGVLPGGGVILYKLGFNIKETTRGESILKEALKTPLKQILINSGLDYEKIINELKKDDFNKIFNVKTNNYESMDKSEILDSTSVLCNSISNAVSISSMLLTTTSLIINEYINNTEKISEFAEL